ncbi:MAG: DUF2185 domain-containing protein, partial [Chitinophagaceae bacterium]
RPGFLYREKRAQPEDSGWRIFTGLESEEYNDNPDNIGIYNPSTILEIDPSLADILLSGVGSVYERSDDGDEWVKVGDFEMEDDYLETHRLTDQWTFDINHLFERSIEDDGTLFYTTGDRSVRLNIWVSEKDRQALHEEYREVISSRGADEPEALEIFDFSDDAVARPGYLIHEEYESREYYVLFGFSLIDKEIVMGSFYFDDEDDLEWAKDTWRSIVLNGKDQQQ